MILVRPNGMVLLFAMRLDMPIPVYPLWSGLESLSITLLRDAIGSR